MQSYQAPPFVDHPGPQRDSIFRAANTRIKTAVEMLGAVALEDLGCPQIF